MAHTIGQRMAEIIKRDTGMSLADIRRKGVGELHRSIEQKIGHPLKFGKEPGHQGRGNVLIQLGRILTRREVEDDFEKHFG